MPNFCAAPNCTRKSTQSDLAFFRFPRDPERCRLWVENCRRADLEEKTPDQLNKHYRLCAKHFEPAMICKTSPYRTVLRDTAIPTIFDLTSHLSNPHSRHRKRIKVLTDEEVQKIKERRLEASMEQLLTKKECETQDNSETTDDIPHLTPEQKDLREFLRSLFEVLVLIGKQNFPFSWNSKEDEISAKEQGQHYSVSTVQDLLENRINAGDEFLRRRFETVAVNEEYCPAIQQKQIIEVCKRCFREEILQQVRECRFFSIVTGELVEFPEGEHLPIFLRYVDQDSTLREEFIEFLSFEGEEVSVAERLESQITKEWGLSMEHCRGQVHAGCGILATKMKVIAAKLNEKYPTAVITPSSTCALNVHLANGMSLTGVQVVMSVLKKMNAFFKGSPLLQAELDNAISIVYQGNMEKENDLKEHSHSTWTELHNVFEMAVDMMEPLLLCMDSIHDNEDLKWNDQITSDAYTISEALADFEFVVTLVVLKNALSFTRAFGKNLQGETLDVFFAANSLTAVLHSLHEVLHNLEVYHEFWFEEAVNLAMAMEIPVKVPRLFLRKQQAMETMEIQAESFFKDYLTLPVMEYITQEVQDIFSENHLKALKCLSLVPQVMGQMKFNTSEESHADIYRSDLPHPDTLPAELHCWRIKWKHRSKEVSLPCTIHETLQHSDVKFFPNVNAFLKILATLPVLKLDGSLGETAQKRLQAYLKDTTVNKRCKSLAVLNINYHIKTDFEEMVQCYIKSYPEVSEND
ncbi:52 kDa repressor of the inhibitor of the protein kinase-like isoform X1 [Xyrauchen texanus]|uniref:52 kDa repressor of the inhibitor of the protein kinase-like isoform X1 n=2 Tax=Xyrauchen texanus TaxID=154827 RepID=UPI0022429944|nr:52 kDa repressor of the inhibitor of the protein kinase-like isoform X1 [Xyrauchen texanus]